MNDILQDFIDNLKNSSAEINEKPDRKTFYIDVDVETGDIQTTQQVATQQVTTKSTDNKLQDCY